MELTGSVQDNFGIVPTYLNFLMTTNELSLTMLVARSNYLANKGFDNHDDDDEDANEVVVREYATYESKCERLGLESVCLHQCHYLQPHTHTTKLLDTLPCN